MGYGQIAASGKRRGYDEAVDAVMQGTPLQRVAGSSRVSGSPTGAALVDLRKQLGGRRPPLLRARGPGGVGPLGPQWHREVRFVAKRWPKAFWKSPRLSGGTDMQDRRW